METPDVQAVEAHPALEDLLAARLKLVGLRKKVAGLDRADPGRVKRLPEKQVQAAAQLAEAEAVEQHALLRMDTVWRQHLAAFARLRALEGAEGRDSLKDQHGGSPDRGGGDAAVRSATLLAAEATAAVESAAANFARQRSGKALEARLLPAHLLRHICAVAHGAQHEGEGWGPDGFRTVGSRTHAIAEAMVLSNVTLGCGTFELDKLVVVPDTVGAAEAAQEGSHSGLAPLEPVRKRPSTDKNLARSTDKDAPRAAA